SAGLLPRGGTARPRVGRRPPGPRRPPAAPAGLGGGAGGLRARAGAAARRRRRLRQPVRHASDAVRLGLPRRRPLPPERRRGPPARGLRADVRPAVLRPDGAVAPGAAARGGTESL